MRIAIIGAMNEEINFILPFLKKTKIKQINNFTFHIGFLDNKKIVVVKSGVGKVMSAILITTLTLHFKLDYIINFGSAGGYRGLKIGDVVVGESSVYGDVDVSLNPHYRFGQIPRFPFLYPADPYLLSKTLGLEAHKGSIMTSDSFIIDFLKMETLINKHFSDLNILAFDMESAAFAQACYFFNIPFLALRVISDLVGTDNQEQSFINNLEFVLKKGNDFLISFLKKLLE